MHTIAESDTTSELPEYPMNVIETQTSQPFSVEIQLNKKPVTMEIDTGASLSIMSKHTYQSAWPTESNAPPLQPSSAKLHTYTGESITVLSSINVNVIFWDYNTLLELLIVKGNDLTLMGQNWLLTSLVSTGSDCIVLVLHDYNSQMDSILTKHADLFKPGIGKVEGIQAKLYLSPTWSQSSTRNNW